MSGPSGNPKVSKEDDVDDHVCNGLLKIVADPQ